MKKSWIFWQIGARVTDLRQHYGWCKHIGGTLSLLPKPFFPFYLKPKPTQSSQYHLYSLIYYLQFCVFKVTVDCKVFTALLTPKLVHSCYLNLQPLVVGCLEPTHVTLEEHTFSVFDKSLKIYLFFLKVSSF